MSDSDYKLRILEISERLTEEEFTKLIGRFEAIHECVAKIVTVGTPILEVFGIKTEEAEAQIETLCSTCANPCERQGPNVVNCEDYSEKMEECVSCAYWDGMKCRLMGTCEGAAEWESVDEPDLSPERV